MWRRLLVLLSLPSFAEAARIDAWRLGVLDSDPDDKSNSDNVSLVGDDEKSLASGSEAIQDAAASSLLANGTVAHEESHTEAGAARLPGAKTSALGERANASGTAWLDGALSVAAVAAAQTLSEIDAAARATHAAVPLARAELLRHAVAALDIKPGRCGTQDKGGYLGCNLGCDCGWGRRCYKSSFSVSGGLIDAGVCEASTSVLVAASLLLLVACIVVILLLRFLLLRDLVAKAPPPPSPKMEHTGTSSSSSSSRHVFEPSMSESSNSDSGSEYDVNEGASSGAEVSRAPRTSSSHQKFDARSSESAHSSSTAPTQKMPEAASPESANKLSPPTPAAPPTPTMARLVSGD